MAAASGLAVLPGSRDRRAPAAGRIPPAPRRHQPRHRGTDPGSAGRRLPADHPRRRRQRQHRRRRRRPAGTRRQVPRRRRQRTPARRRGPRPAGPDRLLRLRSPAGRCTLRPGQRRGQPAARRRKAPPAVFGPQKGATAADVAVLDAALARFVDVLAAEIGPRALKAAAGSGRRCGRRGGLRGDRGTGRDPPAGHRRRPGIHRAGRPAGRRGPGDHRRRQPGRTEPARQNAHGGCPGGGAGRRAGGGRLRPHHADGRAAERIPDSGRSTL